VFNVSRSKTVGGLKMSEKDFIRGTRDNINTFFDEVKSDIDSIVNYISEHPKQAIRGAKIAGAVIALGLVSKCSYNAGEEHSFNKILELQNATKIEKPYKVFGPNSMVSSQPAEKHLVQMKEGQQFWYQGKIVTLLERKEDDILGTVGYFNVGKNLMIIPMGSLRDDMTMHETFTKYSRK